ncbi:MAG: winged helix-turn-helix domain-containing protein [Ilumatobacteraceae bacterium]
MAILRLGEGPRSSATTGLDASRYEMSRISVDRRTINRLLALGPDIVVIEATGDAGHPARLAAAVHGAMDACVVVVSDTPVPDAEIISALDAGAADFVVHSSPDVLDARLRVALRSYPTRQAAPSLIRAGDVTMDLNAHVVLIDGDAVRCPPVQYGLLFALASSPGTTITIAELLQTVWGARVGDVHPRRLRIAISTLRRILGSGPKRPKIETILKVGYRLAVPGTG